MSYDNLFWGGENLAGTAVDNHTQWRIKAENLLDDRDIWAATETKYFPLGAISESRDGRRWRYCFSGEALTKAKVIQGATTTGNWVDEIQTNGTVPTAGDKRVTVTAAATASASDFMDGYLCVEQGTGYDEMYIVKDNKAGTANATSGYDIVCEIADTGGIRTAWAITSNISLLINKYKDVIEADANVTATLVGVSLIEVADNRYFWAQTRGPCPVTCDDTDTIVVGDMVDVSADATIPGAIGLADAAADDHVIGFCMRAAATSETAIIDLTIE